MKYIKQNRILDSASLGWGFVGAGIGGVLFSKTFGFIIETKIELTALLMSALYIGMIFAFMLLKNNQNEFGKEPKAKH